MKKKPKKQSLRSLIHRLGNKYFLSLLGAGVIKETLKDLIDNQNYHSGDKKEIKNAIASLEEIEKASKEADSLLSKIKNIVYKKLNPDEPLDD